MSALHSRPNAFERSEARWIFPSDHSSSAGEFSRRLGLEPLVARILAHRGFTEVDQVSAFLAPELVALHDPRLMADMDVAVARLSDAIRKRESILLYGDYDVDGTSSVVVLKKAIEILGGVARFHIPHRLKEGYGMRREVIDRAAREGVKLVISVDTGIRAVDVVHRAKELGLDVIVTDHHLPEANLPPALAVLNPNRPGCSYPNKHLCGAGVVFKLVQALLEASDFAQSRKTALLDSFLKPVAIATVADIVPLNGENRIIVKRGLSGLRQVRNQGLKALLAVAGFEDGEAPTAHQVAFRLAPRINAAGRMASADDVIELFLTESPEQAQRLAAQLDVLNRERQSTEAEIIESILRACEERIFGPDCAAMVFEGRDWHTGVLGIVASRLVERFGRPVFILSDSTQPAADEERHLTGSGRSIPGFHLLEALESMGDLFTRFGGHRQAAGLTLRASQLDEFARRFNAFAAARLTEEDLHPQIPVDALTCFAEITDRSATQILSLGPFGFGNFPPLLCCQSVTVASIPAPLGSSNHLKVALSQNGRTFVTKLWNAGPRAGSLLPGTLVDVALQIEDDPYSKKRGYGSWCLNLKEFRFC